MEHKFVSVQWKADGMPGAPEGVIEGYGSVFDVADLGGDVIAPGAFTKSLQAGRRVRMLLQHDPAAVIGVWDDLTEDGNGLRVRGRILLQVSKGAEAFELVRAGALDGLSIGFKPVKSVDRNGRRVILQADLWEVSLVTFPMNELARIDAVKAAELTEREFERVLTRDAGLSRSVALRLMSGGWGAVRAMRDAGADDAAEVARLLRARLALQP